MLRYWHNGGMALELTTSYIEDSVGVFRHYKKLAEKAMGAPLSTAAWHDKPSYAILTTRDHVISPELQRWMYQRSGAKVTELAASHAVFVSQPEAVARVIEAAAK